MKRALSIAVFLTVIAVLRFTFTPDALLAQAQDSPIVVTEGLNGPMGILLGPDGGMWVVDSGVGGDQRMPFPNITTYEVDTVSVGNTSRVLWIGADGKQTELATLPSMVVGPGEIVGAGRLAMLDGSLYVTSGVWIDGGPLDRQPLMASIVRVDDGQAHEVATTYDIESEMNPDGRVVESNPWGVTAGPDGMLWISDAGANTIVKVDPSTGAAEIVALLEELPSPLPNPHHDNRMATDPVPTGLVLEEDGSGYVSLLSGFPFVPGSAKVVKLDRAGKSTDFATGLTMLVDLQRGPDGHLYAVSFGEFTEQGPVPQSGAIVRIGEGETSAKVISGLSFPTSIDFAANGDAYVTANGVGAPGSGEVVMYKGLAAP